MDEEMKFNCILEKHHKQEEALQLEMLACFAKKFKQERIRLGFTQCDVGSAIGVLYGNNFSQTTISRFEALNLSYKNMSKLKPLLEKWLIVTKEAILQSKQGKIIYYPSLSKSNNTLSRKKRTCFDKGTVEILNHLFTKNPKPSSDCLSDISMFCGLDERVVRVWFYNRRQKQKRIEEQESQICKMDEEEKYDDDVIDLKCENVELPEEAVYKDVPPLIPISSISPVDASERRRRKMSDVQSSNVALLRGSSDFVCLNSIKSYLPMPNNQQRTSSQFPSKLPRNDPTSSPVPSDAGGSHQLSSSCSSHSLTEV